ncbi:MAG TPA: hypothetical protein VF022_07520 [Rhodanobacteraceae bacterium]|jgi:hypothetical protein
MLHRIHAHAHILRKHPRGKQKGPVVSDRALALFQPAISPVAWFVTC